MLDALGYQLDHQPVTVIWDNLGAHHAELIATAQVGSIRARRDPDLLRSFLAGTGLTL